MCEILVVGAQSPVPFTRIEPWVLALERYGIAGWGWGSAHLELDGAVNVRRAVGKINETPEALDELRQIESRRWLFHLRRPLRLPNVLEDMQPFYSEDRDFAYAHNGDFTHAEQFRDQFDGLLGGKVDSEIGFRMTERFMQEGHSLEAALDKTLETLGGTSNIAVMYHGGNVWIYGKAMFNKLWRFEIDELSCASTSMIMADESFFELVYGVLPSDRELVRGARSLLNAVHDHSIKTAS